MAEIYNQNLTLPARSKPFYKTASFKSLIIIAIAILISCYLIFWQDKIDLIPWGTDTKTEEQQLRDKQRSYLSRAVFTFPDIIKLTSIEPSDLPIELRDFIFTNYTTKSFISVKKLEYENEQTGYFFNYIMNGVTIKDNILGKIRGFNNTPWLLQTGLDSDNFGFMEYKNNKSETKIKIMFTQIENGVQIVVKTLQATK